MIGVRRFLKGFLPILIAAGLASLWLLAPYLIWGENWFSVAWLIVWTLGMILSVTWDTE